MTDPDTRAPPLAPHRAWAGLRRHPGLALLAALLVAIAILVVLWDWNWFRARTAGSVVRRIESRAAAGDIVVMHDGDESDPRRDQRHTVDATARLIPALRARGFEFGTICEW